MMMAAISVPRSSINFRISTSDFFSRSMTSRSRSDSGNEKSIDGLETRGQLKFREQICFARIGVGQNSWYNQNDREKAAAEMQKSPCRARLGPRRYSYELSKSIAALSVFSIASAPPSMNR